MKFTKYERQAAEGKPLLNDLGLVDACMYEALRYLYASHRIGIIERDAAAKEKERLVNLYLAFRAYSFTADKWEEHLKSVIGPASAAYEENPTKENADALFEAFWFRKPGEKVEAKRTNEQ